MLFLRLINHTAEMYLRREGQSETAFEIQTGPTQYIKPFGGHTPDDSDRPFDIFDAPGRLGQEMEIVPSEVKVGGAVR